MKTFLPSLTLPPLTTTVPMVTVATQTDGCVETAYQELCGSSSMATAIDIYDWEDEEEYKVDDFTGTRLQRVMSSQTDLALSDFDLSRCLQWDDEEEEEDRILQGQDDVYDDDTMCNENVNETCQTTMMIEEEPAGQPRPDSASLPPKVALMCETTSRKSPKNRQPSTKESTPPLKQPHLKCLDYSDKRFLKELERRSAGRPPNSYRRMEALTNGMSHVQLSDSLALASGAAEEAMKQRQYGFRDRMVPRMGTKIEFLRTFPNRQMVPMPGSCPQSSAVFPKIGLERSGGVRADGESTTMRFVYADCQESFLVNAYHSDSENSYASIREGGGHHKEWSSDGDADCIAAQTLDDTIEQSLNIVNNELLSSESSRVAMQSTHELFADVMYTNEANLQHTIMLQQRLFKQQLATRKLQDVVVSKIANPPPDVTPFAKPSSAETSKDTCQIQAEIHAAPTALCSHETNSLLEWIVKRRPDGSRYITRRPVRSKLLKERAKQLAAQRDNILTTDDETASEVKIGRYWSKEERKRHLEKARNQKRHRENVMKTRTAKEESPKHDCAPATQQHKLTKQQSRRIVENFTTLKELMLQRGADSKGKTFSPLLSVTTI